MKNLAIARRYAKALLLMGKEDGQTEAYRNELNTITTLMGQAKNLRQVLANPLYDASDRKKVLMTVTEHLNLSKSMSEFLLFLFDKGRFGFLESINDFFQKLADDLKGVARASLVSATELSADTIEKIRQALSRRVGKDIVLEVEQDPGLIGGIVTRIGDLVLDGSVRTQLLNMRQSLKKGESA
ncbi:F0F1 ATP synthase subunit delta [Desulfosarcina sp. OttesenSCG-928-A07]|nr:F0F1 ATP synthase subunit delta [Desulfosarcina sp. OttesenSCG-928-G17]MDL2329414.1 F0F1 ATP synthase subunit delta [Desulfosarcina sp. OttesenSCG-928-A07]